MLSDFPESGSIPPAPVAAMLRLANEGGADA